MDDYQYLHLDNFRIAYIEKNIAAPNCIFFVHGNSGSAKSWKYQFNDERLSQYRLIAVDLPGHGLSSPFLKMEDNNCIRLAEIMLAVIKSFAIKGACVIAGFSLGANIVSEMLGMGYKAQGIVLIGPTIVGGSYTPDKILLGKPEDNLLLQRDNATPELLLPFFEKLSTASAQSKQQMLDDYYKVDRGFRYSFLENTLNGNISNEIAILQEITIPLLIVFGLSEQIVSPYYLDTLPLHLWENNIYKIEGAGHSVQIDQPLLLNALLKRYCDDLTK